MYRDKGREAVLDGLEGAEERRGLETAVFGVLFTLAKVRPQPPA
jgi:hypothetical protein